MVAPRTRWELRSEICARPPEAEREYDGQHVAFRMRGKTFAHFVDDHWCDGLVGVVGKTLPAPQNGS